MPLQTFNYKTHDYTVDYRLSQFRRIRKNGLLSFIEFGSDYGDKILARMIKDGAADWSQLHL